jgi:general transcriptional corepressor CYC8
MAQGQQAPWPQGPPSQQMAVMNEAVWMQIGKSASAIITINLLTDNSLGNFFEMIGQLDEAIGAYEHALRANQRSIPAMNAISSILRTQENFPKAVEYLNQILKLDPTNGDCWGSLGRFWSSDLW